MLNSTIEEFARIVAHEILLGDRPALVKIRGRLDYFKRHIFNNDNSSIALFQEDRIDTLIREIDAILTELS